LYFVATENLMRKQPAAWFLKRYFDPIIHTKGKMGMTTVSSMYRHVKNGYRVALFPEGNRCFDGLTDKMLPSIGKLAKKSGVPLVNIRIEGGFLTSPRFAANLRKGHIHVSKAGVYSVEQLNAMSVEEVTAAIENDLYEDAYERQASEQIPYKGRDLALGLESTLYYCPSCHKFGTLTSTSDSISCSCGLKYSYDELGNIANDEGEILDLRKWNALQKEALINKVKEISGTDEILFEDDVTVSLIEANHKAGKTISGHLAAYSDHVTFNDKTFTLSDISGVGIFQRNLLTAHIKEDNGQYEIIGHTHFNALKYAYLYKILNGEL